MEIVDRMLDSLGQSPAIAASGVVGALPLTHEATTVLPVFTIEGDIPRRAGDARDVVLNVASGGYFSALGIPLVAGRTFGGADGADAVLVVIINEAFQRKYFGDGETLGRRIHLRGETRTIVGVVGSTRQQRITDAAHPEIFVPFAQRSLPNLTLVVRGASGDVSAASLGRTMQAVDGDHAVLRPRSALVIIERQLAAWELASVLAIVWGLAAFGAAILGVAATTGRTVAGGRREIGIRMAMGATRNQETWRVVRRFSGLGLLCAVAGGVGAHASGDVVRSFLYGIETDDLVTQCLVIAVTVSAVTVAAYLAAGRIGRIDPADVLRH